MREYLFVVIAEDREQAEYIISQGIFAEVRTGKYIR